MNDKQYDTTIACIIYNAEWYAFSDSALKQGVAMDVSFVNGTYYQSSISDGLLRLK